MSVRSKLNHIFNRPVLRLFIPLVNLILTKWRRGVWTRTVWDRASKRFELYQDQNLINVDLQPAWMCSKEYLKQTLFRINLKGIYTKADDVIVDIGAGTGTEAIIFSHLVGRQGLVYAIEAHPQTFDSLNQLVTKGGYSNIKPFHLAIGDKSGSIWIQDQTDHEKNAVSKNPIQDQLGIEVQMISLDEFVEQNGITKIDHLKVNIEGAEMWMLKGMPKAVNLVQTASISCHDFLNGDDGMTIMNSVREFFERNGFKVSHYPHSHVVMNSWLYMSRG